MTDDFEMSQGQGQESDCAHVSASGEIVMVHSVDWQLAVGGGDTDKLGDRDVDLDLDQGRGRCVCDAYGSAVVG